MSKALEINYTEKELAAIEVLKANRGQKLKAADLGIATGTLTSIFNKGSDERPMVAGVERVILHKEAVEGVCPTCGKKFSHVLYWVD